MSDEKRTAEQDEYIKKTFLKINYIVPLKYGGRNSSGDIVYSKLYYKDTLVPIEEAPVAMIADADNPKDIFFDESTGSYRKRVEKVVRLVKRNPSQGRPSIQEVVTEDSTYELQSGGAQPIAPNSSPASVTVEVMKKKLKPKKQQ